MANAGFLSYYFTAGIFKTCIFAIQTHFILILLKFDMIPKDGQSIQTAETVRKYPRGYKAAFLINLSLLAIGFILEYLLSAYKITLPGWPVNLIIMVSFISILWACSRFINHKNIAFFYGVPSAITAIGFVMFLVLLMGLIPQIRQEGAVDVWGLTHLKNSWPYLLATAYLLIILGLTTIQKFKKFNLKNIAFFLNHAGLWILIATASLGAADMERYQMNLVKDRAIYYAVDQSGKTHQMDFAIKLLDFSIEEYPPTLGVLNEKDSKFVMDRRAGLFELGGKNIFEIPEWKFEVLEYIPEAKMRDRIFEISTIAGAVPAAKIMAINKNTGAEKTGWITSGNLLYQPQILSLGDSLSLVMLAPKPKKFSSKLRIFKTVDEFEDAELIVNKPIKAFGYKIYQVGYDESMGKWSRMSAIELVRDPWLPLVYIGIFMLLAGAVYLAWTGRSNN